MSCSAPRKISYYSNKVNIYDSDCFIPLPNWKTCPAPSCIILSPHFVYPSCVPCDPPKICPIPQPLNPPGAYCGKIIAPYNPPCGNPVYNYGTTPQSTGCNTCPSSS